MKAELLPLCHLRITSKPLAGSWPIEFFDVTGWASSAYSDKET
jgi:hypothetical protein